MKISHPKFDRDMEIMCCVPPSPNAVPVGLIADDCEVAPQYVVTAVVKYQGKVFRSQESGMMLCNFDIPGWRLMRPRLEQYWARVYGGTKKRRTA